MEISAEDARRTGVTEAQYVRITTARGSIDARARITDIRPGVVFVPFHYGYWDLDAPEHARAANELTRTDRDPVSRQPLFKSGRAAHRADRHALERARSPGNFRRTAFRYRAEAVVRRGGRDRWPPTEAEPTEEVS